MSSFDRGFKSWAERTAGGLRRDLKLKPSEPLDPQTLSTYLGVQLITPKDVKGLSNNDQDQLLTIDKDGWSAVTLSAGSSYIIIYNTSHSSGRQSSDIMHELSHLIIGHEPSKIILSEDGNTVLRSHDKKQEDEADWLAWCLLLPREALLHIKKIRLSNSAACIQYKVSERLLKYRLDVTGVNFQTNKRMSFS